MFDYNLRKTNEKIKKKILIFFFIYLLYLFKRELTLISSSLRS